MSKLCLQVYMLGSFKLKVNNREIYEDAWKSKKALTLFKFLAAKKDKKIPKEVLMELLWPENGCQQSHNLHTTIYYIRRTLDSLLKKNKTREYIKYAKGKYWFKEHKNCWLDYAEFKKLYEEGRALEGQDYVKSALKKYKQALSLYRGDFLEEDLYVDWVRKSRQNYREMYIDIILRKSSLIAGTYNNYLKAADICRQGLKIDPFREEIYQFLLSYLIKAGNYTEAVREYQEYSENLYNKFGLYPGPKTQELYKKISILRNRENKKTSEKTFQCDRKTFELVYDLNLRRQERTKDSFSVMTIKANTNTNGKILQIINNLLRKGDVICPGNGEEIFILLFQVGRKAAEIIKRRLKSEIKNKTQANINIYYNVIQPGDKVELRDIAL